MLEIFAWITTVLSITGVILNIKRLRMCFFIWTFTNASWMVIDFYKGIYAQAFLFLVYTLLAVWGIISWGAKKELT